MKPSDFADAGGELEIFALARNWKRYWSSVVRKWSRGDVAEVGAGLGANTALLQGPRVSSWLCVEPDSRLARDLARAVRQPGIGVPCEVVVGTLDRVSDRQFDTILYIDVLEHVVEDQAEVTRAISRLREGGAVVVLVPAHQRLFSPFDSAIGHHRRYDATSLRSLTPAGARLAHLAHLDSVGLLASTANALLLRQSMPARRQILFWDRVMVPCSRVLDPLLAHRVGKSILAVWEKRTDSDR